MGAVSKRKKVASVQGQFEYWRGVIHTLCKTYNWTRDYVLSLNEIEIYQHLFEIRRENIESTVTDYLIKNNVNGLMQLDDNDAVKMLYIKRKNEWKKEEDQQSELMLPKILQDLQNAGVKLPKGVTVN